MWDDEIRKEVAAMRRRDSMIRDPMFCNSDLWKTEKQWFREGYVLKEGAVGIRGYASGQMADRCTRYHRLEVRKKPKRR